MNKIYNIEKNKFIAYNQYKSNKKNSPYVIFLHGFMSNMDGVKAKYIENYCKNLNFNFLRFDNFGHGQSSGTFIDETIGSWLGGLQLVLEQLTDTPAILVGSSMGGWLSLLAALKFPSKIQSLICLAPAPDFTEESIWQKLPPFMQDEMQQKGWLNITNADYKSHTYIISHRLIAEARNHLLLTGDNINITCPIHLIHGSMDRDVAPSVSSRLFDKLASKNIVIKLIKDADHRLSRPCDLKIITNSLDELINT
jgi:pimeloyl-ACP methyl ester carboxylesterase